MKKIGYLLTVLLISGLIYLSYSVLFVKSNHTVAKNQTIALTPFTNNEREALRQQEQARKPKHKFTIDTTPDANPVTAQDDVLNISYLSAKDEKS